MTEEHVGTTDQYACSTKFTVHNGVMNMQRQGNFRPFFTSRTSVIYVGINSLAIAFESTQSSALLLCLMVAFLSTEPGADSDAFSCKTPNKITFSLHNIVYKSVQS